MIEIYGMKLNKKNILFISFIEKKKHIFPKSVKTTLNL